MAERVEGVRARARRALTEEIKECARRQLAESGAAGLSLRKVARELGVVSSALYRYFPSRDALLSALIIDAYNDLARTAEQAVRISGGFGARWCVLAGAVRSWAHAHPQDYALLYGSPVPGYRAPADTIAPAARVAGVALGLLVDAVATGEIGPGGDGPAGDGAAPTSLGADLAVLRANAPGVPDSVLLRALWAWSQLFGHLSLELFGHFHNVIEDLDTFFADAMAGAAQRIVGPG